jgi:hypothetical protein
MSRRLTGWVLTAAVIAAGPAPALSNNDPNETQGFRPVVAQADAVPPAGGYTDCLEVTNPRDVTGVRGGEIPVLKGPYPSNKANGDVRFERGMAGDADERLLGAIDRSKRAGTGPAMLPWPSLPEGKLMPEGAVQPTQVRAACGIPKGLTLLLPQDE